MKAILKRIGNALLEGLEATLDNAWLNGALSGVMVCFFIGLTMQINLQVGWQKEAVAHGFAEYNQVTGQWQWKTNVVRIEVEKGRQ